MVLYLIGLGLGDEKDITVRGLEAVKACSEVWLESYTSVLGVDVKALEAYYGRPVRVASRDTVESECDQIIGSCVDADVALLVVGDSLCATTHADIALRARAMGARVEVILNASVMAAVGKCGLQLYSYGATVSICFFEGEWRPTSFYDKVLYNARGNMHTLCLLDIKVREPDYEALAKTGRTTYLPPRFMTVNQCVDNLLEAEAKHQGGVCTGGAMAVGCARLGQPTELIVAGTLDELRTVDFGGPLHCLVLCAPELHELERDYLAQFPLPVAPPPAP